MKRIIHICLLLISCSFMNACNSDEVHAELSPKALDIVVLHYGDMNANDNPTKETRVIRSQYGYEAELPKYSSDTPEQLNFSEGVVLIVSMGKRPNSGYWLYLTSVTEESDYNVAHVMLNKAGGRCLSMPVVTSPFHIIWVPSAKELLVRETLEIDECE